MSAPETLAIIAGNGAYPFAMAASARRAGVKRLVAAAFRNETDPAPEKEVEHCEWVRGGQLGKILGFLQKPGPRHAVMSGQIHPSNLFDLRPDLKALILL